MNKLDEQYKSLIKEIIDFGHIKEDRTGTGTLALFSRQVRHRMSDGFPLITTKKMHWKSIVIELLWFLKGDTNIKYLIDNNCHIWDGDALKAYHKHEKKEFQDWIKKNPDTLVDFQYTTMEEFINKIKTDDEFAEKFGELGPVYGQQWRKWGERYSDWKKFDGGVVPKDIEIKLFLHKGLMARKKIKGIDQIANSINLLKTDPDSRRNIISAWNPSDLSKQILPPCHLKFQFFTRKLSDSERFSWYCNQDKDVVHHDRIIQEMDKNNVPTRAISLQFDMRSTDVGLGLPFNLASYGLLLMMIAKQVNMIPEELVYTGVDVHLYLNHIELIKEQLNREGYKLPTVKISDKIVSDISEYTLEDIILENYESHPTIKLPLSN